MFPREIIWYIFLFQEIYLYFLISNTLHSLKKIKETLGTYHPPKIDGSPPYLSSVTLPITKTKYYDIFLYWTRTFNYHYTIRIIDNTDKKNIQLLNFYS